jgi:hypothetical protein
MFKVELDVYYSTFWFVPTSPSRGGPLQSPNDWFAVLYRRGGDWVAAYRVCRYSPDGLPEETMWYGAKWTSAIPLIECLDQMSSTVAKRSGSNRVRVVVEGYHGRAMEMLTGYDWWRELRFDKTDQGILNAIERLSDLSFRPSRVCWIMGD